MKTQQGSKGALPLLALILIVVLAVIIIILLINKDKPVSLVQNQKDSLTKTEYEQNTVRHYSALGSESSNERKSISSFIFLWLSDIENNNNIDKYYAGRVNYFGSGNVPRAQVLADKNKFYDKWDKIVFKVENLEVNNLYDDKYECIFDKYFEVSNYSNNKIYKGKVQSKIDVEKIQDEYYILTEKDLKIYYTDKNY